MTLLSTPESTFPYALVYGSKLVLENTEVAIMGPKHAQSEEQITLDIPAPDFMLTASTGDRVKLSDFRNRMNVVLYFMRAFNCMQCRDFARRLAAAAPELRAINTQVMIIGPGTRQEAERLSRGLDNTGGAIILFDGTGSAYDAFMLNRVFFSLIQKSAAFIIDKAGIIRYAQTTANPNRWLSGNAFSEMLHELETL